MGLHKPPHERDACKPPQEAWLQQEDVGQNVSGDSCRQGHGLNVAIVLDTHTHTLKQAWGPGCYYQF